MIFKVVNENKKLYILPLFHLKRQMELPEFIPEILQSSPLFPPFLVSLYTMKSVRLSRKSKDNSYNLQIPSA